MNDFGTFLAYIGHFDLHTRAVYISLRPDYPPPVLQRIPEKEETEEETAARLEAELARAQEAARYREQAARKKILERQHREQVGCDTDKQPCRTARCAAFGAGPTP